MTINPAAIRTARLGLNLSQEQLADLIGCSAKGLAYWERQDATYAAQAKHRPNAIMPRAVAVMESLGAIITDDAVTIRLSATSKPNPNNC